MFSISNILKGDSANKKYFFDMNGSSVFLNQIMNSKDMEVI